MMANIYIKIYMTSHGLYISSFIWEVMAYTYEDLYDKWWLIYIKIYMKSNGLYIYIKVYMISVGLYISRFIWQMMG